MMCICTLEMFDYLQITAEDEYAPLVTFLETILTMLW